MKMSNSASRNTSLDQDTVSPVQTHALQLALKTMNERCQQLQQRLTAVEDENVKLRVKIDSDKTLRLDCSVRPSEYEQLREKVEELNRQKNQLSHHINMVATENRHLWSRLSKMTKDNHSIGSAQLPDSIEQQQQQQQQSTESKIPQHHHIIRSKTFTQSTPNSKLCPKIDSESDLSLEEISLKLINNFIQDKSVLEEQYEQMVEMHSDIDCNEFQPNLRNIVGFSYITDGNEGVSMSQQCVEGYDLIRKQISKQKNDLLMVLSNLRKRSNETICSKCRTNLNLSKTPENDKRYLDFNNDTKWATPVTSTSQLLDSSNLQIDTNESDKPKINTGNLFRPISDVDLDKNDSDESYQTMISRVCPMCTEMFPNMSLQELTDHVETHFIGENDNLVLDNNYEIVTHTVGNF